MGTPQLRRKLEIVFLSFTWMFVTLKSNEFCHTTKLNPVSPVVSSQVCILLRLALPLCGQWMPNWALGAGVGDGSASSAIGMHSACAFIRGRPCFVLTRMSDADGPRSSRQLFAHCGTIAMFAQAFLETVHKQSWSETILSCNMYAMILMSSNIGLMSEISQRCYKWVATFDLWVRLVKDVINESLHSTHSNMPIH